MIIYGVGETFRTRDIVMVKGIRIITVRMLLSIAEKIRDKKARIIIRGIGRPFESLMAITAKNWKVPISSEVLTINIMPKINRIERRLTNPSEFDPTSNSTMIEKSNPSI